MHWRLSLLTKCVRTDKGDLPYYELVVALVSEPNYHRIKGAEEHSLCVSSVEAAAEIRDKLKKALEQRNSRSENTLQS